MTQAHQTTTRKFDCGGVLLEVGGGARPLVMGILNVTPDSFSDGGRFLELSAAIDRAGEMIGQGADIIDIGGESTRPAGKTYGQGAQTVEAAEEIDRVLPVVEALSEAHPACVISIDTYKSLVAEIAVRAGAGIVNDVTGLRGDPEMPATVAQLGVPVVVMHSAGLPGSLPHESSYIDVIEEVVESLARSVRMAREAGIGDVIVDPGFGFGKSVSDNLRLVGELDALKSLDCPILIGISRKSSIGAVLKSSGTLRPVDERLAGSLAATTVALANGADVVRTHDVRATRDAVDLFHAISLAGREAVGDPA